MTEKFYCVGCKQHYELDVHAAQRQPSKGGSFRHSLISECPKGHRVNKLCKKEVYETYSGADKKSFHADNFGDMEYLLLEVMTKEQVLEEYGDYMEDSGITIKQLPQKLQDDYRTDEEAEYLRNKYLKLADGDFECASCSGIYEQEQGKMIDSEFFCNDCEEMDAETFESPYVGSKALSGVSLTTDQLTETIGSGDFDKASLNSSGHQNIFANAEEGSAPVQDPMEFGEMANWTPLDGTPSLKKRKRAESQTSSDLDCDSCGVSGPEREGEPLCSRCVSCFECCEMNGCADYDAEGMTVGVNLEALEPTPDEPETGVSMVPADSLMPEGSGHVIGSQSTSHNFTPFHAEVEMIECGNCDKTFTIDEGLDIGGIDYCEECYDTRSSKEVHSAETFIAYPELKNHLVSIMPDKVYNINLMEDGDFEMSVANRYMDEVISAVSDYQATEKSDSDLVFGQSKTTVAVAAASLAVIGAWLWNKRK